MRTVELPNSILVVEDNAINREIAAALLLRSGFKVDTANDGVEAVAAVRSKRYALILMDVHMPRMDGIEATRQIRAMDGPSSRTPIAAVTANAMSGARAEYLSAGMDDYMSKPYSRDQLYALIARWAGPPPPEKTAPTAPVRLVVDFSMMEELLEATSLECVREMIDAYHLRTSELLQAIRHSMVQHDHTPLTAAAHELAGMAGTIGAIALSDAARQIEHDCRDVPDVVVRELAARLAPLAEQSAAELDRRFPGRCAAAA